MFVIFLLEVLKDSLIGEDARTVLIATVNPSSLHCRPAFFRSLVCIFRHSMMRASSLKINPLLLEPELRTIAEKRQARKFLVHARNL